MKNKMEETVNLKKKLEKCNLTLCGSREKSKAKKNNINLRLLCSRQAEDDRAMGKSSC